MADGVRIYHQRGKDPHEESEQEESDTPVCVPAKHATIEGYKALIIEATYVVLISGIHWIPQQREMKMK